MDHVSPHDPPRYLQQLYFCITFGWKLADFMTHQGSYSVQIFVSLCQDFDWISGQFYLNFNQELGHFELKLARIWLRFH